MSMSIHPPPDPPNRGLSNAAAWLIALGIVAVAVVATVALVTLGGGDGSDETAAGTDTSTTSTTGAVVGTSPEPTGPTTSAVEPPEEVGTPGPGEGPSGSGETPPPTGGETELTLSELSLPSVPFSALIAACIQEAPAREMPSGAEQQTTLEVDFDGDRVVDIFSVYREGATWYLRMDTSGGHAAEMVIPGVPGEAEMNKIVRFGEELTAMVRTSFADDPDAYRFFLYRDCTVREITPGGEALRAGVTPPLVFPDIPALVSGFTCTGDGITVTTAVYEGVPGIFTHTVESRSYTWRPESGTFEPGPPISLAACCDWPEQREIIEAVGELDCPGGLR
jgi:hypothetical protein